MKKWLFVLILYSNSLFPTWKSFIVPCCASIMSISPLDSLVITYKAYKKPDEPIRSKLGYTALSAASIISIVALGFVIYEDCKRPPAYNLSVK